MGLSHEDRMSQGPRRSYRRRQYVWGRYARTCHPAGVRCHITQEGNASEPGRPQFARARSGGHGPSTLPRRLTRPNGSPRPSCPRTTGRASSSPWKSTSQAATPITCGLRATDTQTRNPRLLDGQLKSINAFLVGILCFPRKCLAVCCLMNSQVIHRVLLASVVKKLDSLIC